MLTRNLNTFIHYLKNIDLRKRFTFMRLQFTGISFLLALTFYCLAFAQRSAAEYFEDGNTKAGTGDFNGAMQAYTSVISMNPDHAPSYFNRGLAKANLKDYRGAMQD